MQKNNKTQNKKIRKVIEKSIVELIGTEEEVNDKIQDLLHKHKKKVHFAPIKYRVLGGFLQSLNIRFGNFLEVLLANIIQEASDMEVLMVSEMKVLALDKKCERIIDNHINHPPKKLNSSLANLYKAIFSQSQQNSDSEKFDVDLLIKDDNKHYYLEVKYNDDHDTGKFKDINRKAIKTYAGLTNALDLKSQENFQLIIYYFNPHKRYYPSPYLRDRIEVLRADELFAKFHLGVNYKLVEKELLRLNKDLEAKFDYYANLAFKIVEENSKSR